MAKNDSFFELVNAFIEVSAMFSSYRLKMPLVFAPASILVSSALKAAPLMALLLNNCSAVYCFTSVRAAGASLLVQAVIKNMMAIKGMIVFLISVVLVS